MKLRTNWIKLGLLLNSSAHELSNKKDNWKETYLEKKNE